MGVTNYLSIDGEILSEHREGESQNRNYITDAMGSVIEVYMGTSLKADATYTAFGGDISASWRISEYRFQWVGSWGYRKTGKDWVNTYVRARHYSTSDGAWGSVDPLWPKEAAYRYVEGRVMERLDPSGTKSVSYSSTIPSYPGGRNYGCATYPCCEYNTKYWENQCKTTGNRFTCCASKVSRFICDSVHLSLRECNSQPPGLLICLIDPLSIGGYPLILLQHQAKVAAACDLARRTDCQNSCMRYNHQIGLNPLWARARRICSTLGNRSKACCVASFRAEQREYETCARSCFPALGAIPYSLRINFGLKALKCCD